MFRRGHLAVLIVPDLVVFWAKHMIPEKVYEGPHRSAEVFDGHSGSDVDRSAASLTRQHFCTLIDKQAPGREIRAHETPIISLFIGRARRSRYAWLGR